LRGLAVIIGSSAKNTAKDPRRSFRFWLKLDFWYFQLLVGGDRNRTGRGLSACHYGGISNARRAAI